MAGITRHWELNQPYANVLPNSSLWKQVRSQCLVTCSEYADACNCADAYTSRKRLYEYKKGISKRVVNEYTQALFDNGNQQEKEAVRCLRELGKAFFQPGFFFDLEDMRLGGSPDGLIISDDNIPTLVEIKSPETMVETVKDVKMRYVIQVTGLLHAMTLNRAVLIYFNAGMKTHVFEITFNPALWGQIKSLLGVFMLCMEKDAPPMSPFSRQFKDYDITSFVKPIEIKDI